MNPVRIPLGLPVQHSCTVEPHLTVASMCLATKCTQSMLGVEFPVSSRTKLRSWLGLYSSGVLHSVSL